MTSNELTDICSTEDVLDPDFQDHTDCKVGSTVADADLGSSLAPISPPITGIQAADSSSSTVEYSLGAAFRPAKTKICLVCGDKALGCNFSAVSCESCKAFFRRNALKTVRGRCTGGCDVTVETRSYCKKCRLQKCFDVGMRKDLILDDKQKTDRRRKIHENRCRRSGLDATEDLTNYVDTPSTSDVTRGAETSPAPALTPRTHIIAGQVDTSLLAGLPENDLVVLNEVMNAFKLSFDQPAVPNSFDTENPSQQQLVNKAEISIKRLVKMAKALPAFAGLPTCDQITLLKECCIEVLVLRTSTLVDPHQQRMAYQEDGQKEVNITFSKMWDEGSRESRVFLEHYLKFMTNCQKALKNDNVSLMLLIVLSLFSPDRPGLKKRAAVEDEQQRHSGVLRAYLTHRYPDDPPAFARIVQKLTDIREMNECYTGMLKGMDINQLEPVIVEIFGLSTPASKSS